MCQILRLFGLPLVVSLSLTSVSTSFGQAIVSERVDSKAMLRLDVSALSDSLASLQLSIDNMQQPSGPAGQNGEDGASVLNGATAPTSADGSDGDFWINITTWEIFGPKASGTWPEGVSLIGPAGGAPAGSSFACGINTVTYDGYDYSTVAIGDHCWFSENLRTATYFNGDAIPGGLSNGDWAAASSGAQAIYSGDSATYFADFGRLYNFSAVADGRGLCPSGWHVPSDEELTTLTDSFGGTSAAGGALKASPTDSPSWDGLNNSGFLALPGGYRNNNGSFNNLGSDAYFWSSSLSSSNAWFRRFYSNNDNVLRNNGYLGYGFAVRCVRD